jgi:hypothetical protein
LDGLLEGCPVAEVEHNMRRPKRLPCLGSDLHAERAARGHAANRTGSTCDQQQAERDQVPAHPGRCPQNTEISGEPPFGPWLVRCISLFASVLILQDGWVLCAYRNSASVFELYRATGLGLPEINDLIWTLLDGRELAPKEEGLDTRQV